MIVVRKHVLPIGCPKIMMWYAQEVLHLTTLDLQDVISLLNRDNHRSLQWTGTKSYHKRKWGATSKPQLVQEVRLKEFSTV